VSENTLPFPILFGKPQPTRCEHGIRHLQPMPELYDDFVNYSNVAKLKLRVVVARVVRFSGSINDRRDASPSRQHNESIYSPEVEG
jgi:hypothetical protein